MSAETLITVIALVLCIALIITVMLMLVAGVMLQPLKEEQEMNHDDLETWRRSNPGTPIAPPSDDDLLKLIGRGE